MPRQKTLKRLPPEIRELINNLLERGCTLEEVKARLAPQAPAPESAEGGRACADEIAAQMRESRAIAESIAHELSNAPESKISRLSIELLENAVFALRNAEELDVKQVVELSRAVKNLMAARSADAALTLKLRAEGRRESEERAEDEPRDKVASSLQALERVKAIYRGEA